jgi:hypothetical protein
VEQGIQATLLGLSEGLTSLTSQLNDLAVSETALAGELAGGPSSVQAEAS